MARVGCGHARSTASYRLVKIFTLAISRTGITAVAAAVAVARRSGVFFVIEVLSDRGRAIERSFGGFPRSRTRLIAAMGPSLSAGSSTLNLARRCWVEGLGCEVGDYEEATDERRQLAVDRGSAWEV